ncbi:unnamed protein product [Pleuronectes platessa]|uniref:Uncharacterized protein n=1 Tax=Pleuronectes platessa TaxID=8262 RepID=A0A9N7VJL4_PLEPL|nr:unnamed protein product [Pleuronectes platessa]
MRGSSSSTARRVLGRASRPQRVQNVPFSAKRRAVLHWQVYKHQNHRTELRVTRTVLRCDPCKRTGVQETCGGITRKTSPTSSTVRGMQMRYSFINIVPSCTAVVQERCWAVGASVPGSSLRINPGTEINLLRGEEGRCSAEPS